MLYDRELEAYVKIGDTGGWYGNLEEGLKLAGRKQDSEQYIRDEGA